MHNKLHAVAKKQYRCSVVFSTDKKWFIMWNANHLKPCSDCPAKNGLLPLVYSALLFTKQETSDLWVIQDVASL